MTQPLLYLGVNGNCAEILRRRREICLVGGLCLELFKERVSQAEVGFSGVARQIRGPRREIGVELLLKATELRVLDGLDHWGFYNGRQ